MATKEKKTNSRGKTPQRRRSAPEPKEPAYSVGARLAGGLVCLLLALCTLVSYIRADALFLHFFSGLLKGLFGYGYYLSVITLAAAGVILVGHKGRPVALRVTCTLLLTVLAGSLLHLLLSHGRYEPGLEAVKLLWSDGRALLGGGAVSGALAVGLQAVFGKIISGVILGLALLVTLMGAAHVTPQDVAAAIQDRRACEADDAPEEIPVSPRQKAVEAGNVRRPPSVTEFLLDDDISSPVGEPERSAEKTPVLAPREKKSFFARKGTDVQAPDEVLRPREEREAPSAEKAPEEKKTRRRRQAEVSGAEVDEAARQVAEEIKAGQSDAEPSYRYPPIDLLDAGRTDNYAEVGAELRDNSRRLADTLRSFGVDAAAGEVVHGPSVTRYEFMLDQGVKLSKLTNLSDDIALALGVSGVRIAPIPNKISVVGIEVPNKARATVKIRDIIDSRAFMGHKSQVAFVVGKDIGGNRIVGDISRLPHVLIAGTTGSGKSVCTNSLIISLLYRCTPDEVRFIMVDPKMVELAAYNGIPHLLIPVVTDPKKAAGALQWAVFEMMKRYKIFSEKGVKDLAGYNALAAHDPEVEKLPTVVVVIDELADLMIAAAKEVEESICRVAQMGRAAGMHLVIATQSPRADVITGLMKANIPSRIALTVASSLESRIILDTTGAEKLVGYGDMLYFPLGMQKPLRVQGCFVAPEEIERVVRFVKDNGEANYDQGVIDQIEAVAQKEEKGKSGGADEGGADESDELLPAAVDVVLEVGQASVSMLQRRLKLGYSRAARLVDQMEERGIVGPFEGSKPRQLLITRAQWQEMQMKNGDDTPEPEFDRYGSIHDVFESHDALE